MIVFDIPGKPYAKKRVKATARGGFARVYDPKENVSFERSLGMIALPHFQVPLEGPVRLSFVATVAPSKSWPKKKLAATVGQYHTQKPDLDNIEKAIKDGLNRIAWADDSQVAEVRKRKVWGLDEGTSIMIEQLSKADLENG